MTFQLDVLPITLNSVEVMVTSNMAQLEVLPATLNSVEVTVDDNNFTVELSIVPIGVKGDPGEVNPLTIANAQASAVSATNAANSATAAAGSATGAASSASSASTSASNAATSATSAAGSATTATTQAANSATSATSASNSASAALASKNAAATSESNSANSATSAATQAANAASSTTSASTSATNAFNSATSAAASAALAASNGANSLMKSNNLSDLSNTATARTNLGVPFGSGTSTGTNTGDQLIPTSLPASDVYAWAKAATKPTYTYSEVGAQVAGIYASGTGSASGTNTGDETAATIKTKLGITTLSGSNTGDQVLPTLASLGAYAASNPSGYISSITSANVTTALGFTPYNSTNPSGFISGITSANVTNALGFTPYNATNPNGYITSSGSISGNAATATTLQNGRSINGVSFNGSADINIRGFSSSGNDYNTGGIELYGNGSTNTVFPSIGFHQPALFASSIQLRGAGDFRFYAQGAGSYANVTAATFNGALNGNATTATTASLANGVNQYPNRTDAAWYQAVWSNAAGGDKNIYSTSNVGIYSGNYGYVGFGLGGSTWIIGGNASYGLYSNTGLYLAGGMYAPIYYDSNDTNYYCDPNGTSRLETVNASTLRSYSNVYTDQNFGYGLVGVYSSYRYQGVYSMGASWGLAADGTTTGNLYGLAWSHPNAGGVAGNLNTHGLLALENGGFLAALSGSTRARDDMRAPIFYDGNDTGYYCDPNGYARLNNVQPNTIRLPADSGYYLFENSGNANCRVGHVMANVLQSYNQSYATIMYDQNDTSYYCDPNWYSEMYIIRANAPGGGRGAVMVNEDERIGRWIVGGGYFEVLIDGNAYGVSFFASDENIKKNIAATTYNALNTIDQIQFKEFDYDPTKSIHEGHVKCGVIAQQIQSVDDNLVEQKGDFLAPKLDQMVYISQKAIQELHEKIKFQQTQIDALIAKVGI